MQELLSEFEDLLRIREFETDKRLREPYLRTYEKIAKALKEEYSSNIDDKVHRWIDVTHIQYFKNIKSVTYFFQAKMLYRDGFYESAIMLCRSISEMICYELLNDLDHAFGDINLTEVPSFRIYVDFLFIQKAITKNEFEQDIIGKLSDLLDKNFIKSSYDYDKSNKAYQLKNEVAKERKNLNRFLEIFLKTGYDSKGSFNTNTHQLFHKIYDLGNLYVHSKAGSKKSKEDAKDIIIMLTQVLHDVFGLDSDILGKTIKSGYTEFPDISKGLSFAIEFGLTPEAAQRVYYNIPSQKNYDNIKRAIGNWTGKWQKDTGEIETGHINFRWEPGDMIFADLLRKDSNGLEIKEPIEIRLFEGYMHLVVFDSDTSLHDPKVHIAFELDFFEDDMLLGIRLGTSRKAVFKRKD